MSFGLGALHMGSLLDKEASKRIVFRALERGISFFDTAPLYGSGRSEEILGEALLKFSGHPITVCTKAGLCTAKRKDGQFGVAVAKLNAATLQLSVETSLKRLKREKIDLLMLHAFDETTPLDETLAALGKLHKEGKVATFGCSNYNPQQLSLLIRKADPKLPLAAAQCHYNMIERRAAKSFIPLCDKHSVRVVVNRMLARGALVGQYGMGRPFRQNSRAAISPRIQKWLTDKKLILLDSLSSAAKESGVSLMQISLKWLLKNHPQVIALLGVRSEEQMDQIFKAAAVEIDEAVFNKVEEILKSETTIHQAPPRYFEK